MSSENRKKRVCVVGAGMSGLVALKECLGEGFQVTCYELDKDLGGIWHSKDDHDTFNTPVTWSTLITNTTKYLCTFSDFPPTADTTPYLVAQEMKNYYVRYAKHFNLLPHIQFYTRVLKVRKTHDHDRTGQWEVYTKKTSDFKNGDMRADLKATEEDLRGCKKEIYDYVLVCSGFFKKPKFPEVSGLDTFTGIVEHSFAYLNSDKYADKNVLVVGNSYSAGDVANDIAQQAHNVYLGLGSGTWIVPRITSGGRPLDTIFSRSGLYAYDAKKKFDDMLIAECQNRMDHFRSGVSHEKPPSLSPYMMGDDIYLKLFSNRIQTYGRLTSFKGSDAYFSDGTKLQGIDAVVFCTGFDPDLSFLDVDIIEESGKMDLYKMLLPTREKKNTLAFVGLFAGDSPILPMSEMQARYIAKVFAGKIDLPSREKMQEDADRNNAYSLARRGQYSYLMSVFTLTNELAQELGVYPSFWKVFFRDPTLAFRVWYGPMFTAHYRLFGFDSDWNKARDISHRAYSEGLQPLRHQPEKKLERSVGGLAARLMKMVVILPVTAAVGYYLHIQGGLDSVVERLGLK